MDEQAEFLRRVDGLAGQLGWWNHSTGEAFRDVALQLRAKDIPDDEVLGFLETLYGATADEFGA